MGCVALRSTLCWKRVYVLLLDRQKRPPVRGMQEALYTCGGKEEEHGRDTRCRCHTLSTPDYTG